MKELQDQFKKEFKDVNPLEISSLEQELVDSKELEPDEIVKLCDLHVALVQEALDDHRAPDEIPGHPLNTYNAENEYAKKLIKEIRETGYSEDKIKELSKIVIHYERLQNQLFPELERAGFSGPSQVMWAKQDEIKEMLKNVNKDNYEKVLNAIEEQILKEEKVLFPTAAEILDVAAWSRVKIGEEEIGFAWVKPGNEWKPVTPEFIHNIPNTSSYGTTSKKEQPAQKEVKEKKKETKTITPGVAVELFLETGHMPAEMVNIILKSLPGDITIINENDEVIYYTNTDHRIFPRSPNIIGRKVQKCHPPKSIKTVERILQAFKEGKKDKAEFWIQLNGKFILIRYYALRDAEGNYKGVMEFSQDLTWERSLQGERRLLNWDDA